MTFHVGQKVVCVDDVPHHRYVIGLYPNVIGDLDGLTADRVYTVRAIGRWIPKGPLIIWLREIARPIRSAASRTYGEAGFAAERFRPVVERKTDISALVKIAEEAARTGKVLA